MATAGYYTSGELARIKDAGILAQLQERAWDLKSALRADARYEREPGGYTETKARELDRIHAEAQKRGMI